MLFSIMFTIVLWSVVKCEVSDEDEDDIKIEKRNFTELYEIFMHKYMGEGKGYIEWKKLHEMSKNKLNLENVCTKYALMLSNQQVPIRAAGIASFRDKYTLMEGPPNAIVEIDTLTCITKFLDKKGEVTHTMKYYLTEADEPDSAFRFSLLQGTIVLTRKLTNIWSTESDTGEMTVRLNIRRRNVTTTTTTTTTTAKAKTTAKVKTTTKAASKTTTTMTKKNVKAT